MSSLNPLAIMLVTSGTRGDRLLFKYPYEEIQDHVTGLSKAVYKNPYSQKISEDRLATNPVVPPLKLVKNGALVGFQDKTLANILAVKGSLCGSKFTLEIDEVCFVGYPIQLTYGPKDQFCSGNVSQPTSTAQSHRINRINVVFALNKMTPTSAISSYHDLAKELVVALHYEQRRCHYLSDQSKIIRSVFDDVQSMPEDSMQNPFKLILQQSRMACELKQVYTSLVDSGIVCLYINHWVQVNFCFPHKVHALPFTSPVKYLEPEDIEQRIKSIRPYHGLLLQQPVDSLLDELPLGSSPALIRLLRVVCPTSSLQSLSLDADLTLSQVFLLACHLLYWGKARVIYPLCMSNEYVLSPTASLSVASPLTEEFAAHFPHHYLHSVLALFSVPCQLWDMQCLEDFSQVEVMQMVVWLLQKHLLVQLFRYVYLLPGDNSCSGASITDSTLGGTGDEGQTFNCHMDIRSGEGQASSMSDVGSSHSDGWSISDVTDSISTLAMSDNLARLSRIQATTHRSVVAVDDPDTRLQADLRQHQQLKDNIPSQSLHRSILHCPASRSPEDLNLFLHLCPYFNGRHHIEEIMFYESIHRSRLLTLLDKFKDILIVFIQE